MDLTKQFILVPAIMTLMLASAMPLLLMPTLQPVEGQFLGDDDSALLPGFNNTTTTNNETTTTTTAAQGMDNEGLQLDLSATSNNDTLLSEHLKTIRYYVLALLRGAIEDRVGGGNADNVRFEIVGFDGNTNSSHNTVGMDDAVSLMRNEFNKLSKASQDSTTAGFEITLDSSQCSSPSAGECQFTITAATMAEGMDNEGLQLDLSATSNNDTLLREYVKTIRFYAIPLLREAVEDRVGEGNADKIKTDNVRFEIAGFGSNHTTVGTDDAVSLMRNEFNKLSKASQDSTTAGFEITLDSSQCSSPSPNLANGECQFTIRLAQKANEAAEAATGVTTIRPPEESGTIGLNDESEQDGTSDNSDDSSSSDDCDNSYPDVCIPPPPPILECSDIDEEDFEVRGSDPHGFDDDNDGVGCEEDNSSDDGSSDDDDSISSSSISSSSSSSSSDDDDSSSSDDCDNSYPDVCIPPPPPILECSDIDEEDFEVRGSDPHGFDSNGDGVGCEEEDSSSSSSSSSSSNDDDNSDDEIDGNSISNFLTNKLDDIFGDDNDIAADQANSVLDKITEDKAQIRQTIEQIAEQIAGATDTD
jgi:hypothetical protein